MQPMFAGPVGPVEVFFYWLEAIFRDFYWRGAIGLLSASSPDVDVHMLCTRMGIVVECQILVLVGVLIVVIKSS